MKRLIALTGLVLAFGGASAAAAADLRFNEVTNEESSVSFLYPVNADWHVFYLNGRKFYLRRTGERLSQRSRQVAGAVSGGQGWVSLRCKGRSESDRFDFRQGRLVAFTHEGKRLSDSDLETAKAWLEQPVDLSAVHATLWTPPDLSDAGSDFWGEGRFRLWFSNPNEAGALLALAALLFLSLVIKSRGIWRVHGLTFTVLTLFCVWSTGSRGALLAFAFGAFVMVACHVAPRLNSRRLVLLAAVFLAVSAAAVLLAGRMRHVRGGVVVDRSTSVRLEVWSAVPQMMNSAPWGWWSAPGHCYCDWFQPLNRSKLVKLLLNGHLTVMVCGGYAVSFLYLFLWLFLLAAVTNRAKEDGRIVAAGQWSALAAAMCFSPVGIVHWEVWVLPVLTTIPRAGALLRDRRFLRKAFGWCAVGAAAVLACIAAGGAVSARLDGSASQVCRSGGAVKVGTGPVRTAVVDDGLVLAGGYYGVLGKELRRHVAKGRTNGSLLLAQNLDDVPPEVGNLVLAGTRCADYLDRLARGLPVPSAARIWFLSPPFAPSAVPDSLRGVCRIVIGALAAEFGGGYDDPPDWVDVVPGAALYVPDWKERVGL